MLNTKILRNDQEVTVAKLRGVVKTVTRISEIEGLEWSVFADRLVAQRDAPTPTTASNCGAET